MNAFQQVLQETEERFAQRAAARQDFQEKVEAGKVLEADAPERVEMRLDRLQISRAVAEAMVDEGVRLAPPPMPERPSAAEAVALERILGGNDLINVNFLEMGLMLSRSIGRIHIRKPNGRTVGYGTGFLVSPRILMTNNHVLSSLQEAAPSQVEFDYQIGLDGNPTPSVFFGLLPDEFFLTDRALDYTLVAVQPRASRRRLNEFGWHKLIAEEGKVIKGEYLNIIQHPNGEPKQLALRENQLIDVLEQFLHYHTDTAPGSSGSPVFNDQWEVVGLHHSGVPKRDDQGNLLTRDGRPWRSWMGEHRIAWVANEGARISRIVRHVKQQQLPLPQRTLRAEMLEIDPFLSAQGPSLRGPSEGRGDQRSQPSTRIVSGGEATGGVTWTVPLEVTVRLGAAAEVPASGGPSPAGGLVPGPDEEQELREALEELERARQRVYYDAEADGEARETYYADIDPSVTPKTMFRHLSKLVRATHTEHPRYRPRRYVYPWVDLHPDHKLRSIYSGVAYEPETFIREDFRISQERALRLQEWMAMESTRDTERLQKEIRLLEARLPYNCEHVVPQSWFEGREPMRGDLHHLFACESGCNSFRGNRAYFDFADFEEALRDECGKLMENKFEPSAGKGAAARATLYFLLRYPGEISGDEIGLTEERLPLMLEWHAAFPVTEYERHRNWAIFEEQGNRNPLIDHPEWAAKIDFTRGFDC